MFFGYGWTRGLVYSSGRQPAKGRRDICCYFGDQGSGSGAVVGLGMLCSSSVRPAQDLLLALGAVPRTSKTLLNPKP